MPRPYTYSRSRRLIMQGVMIAIFGGTLGLAAMVRHARIGESGVPLRVPFSLPLESPEIVGRLPDWDVEAGFTRSLFGNHFARAKEPAQPNELSRTITVLLEPALTNAQPSEHLVNRYGVSASSQFEPLKFAGRKGVMVLPATSAASSNYKGLVWHAYACVILPEGSAVVVHLELPQGVANERDRALLKQVAQSIRQVGDRDG